MGVRRERVGKRAGLRADAAAVGATRQRVIAPEHCYLAGLRYESKGHLEFVRSVTGVRMLKDEMATVAARNEHHLAHIRSALNLANLTPLTSRITRPSADR
jgi:hypothetical protein